jgi:dihydroorotate dehydrogenase electron transfer subunit
VALLVRFGRRACTVVGRETFGPYVVLDVHDADGPSPAPGQFYMLAAVERWGGGGDERPFLPRAFSFLRARDGRLSFLVDDVGPGTRRLMELDTEDELWLTGPLGEGWRPTERRPVLVGGGVGVAPLAALADTLADPPVLLGFRDAHHAEAAALFVTSGQGGSAATRDPDVTLATDDGSAGHQGLVTDLLPDEFDGLELFACGPPAMLEAIRALGVPAQLALESGMACGFGACFGCVTPLAGGGYARVCVDGPVFAAAELAEVPAH